MKEPWLISILLSWAGAYGSFVFGAMPLSRQMMLFASGALLASGVLIEGLTGLLFVFLAEAAVVTDRFLRSRSRDLKFSEKELAGLALYVLPLIAMILAGRKDGATAISLLATTFFCLRQLAWPLALPLQQDDEFPFHNFFVFYLCNLACFLVLGDQISGGHQYIFLLAAGVNAIVGYVYGAAFMGVVYLSFLLPSASSYFGLIGAFLLWIQAMSGRAEGRRLVPAAVLVICGVLSLLTADFRFAQPSFEMIQGPLLLGVGILLALAVRKALLGGENAPGLDVYNRAFELLRGQNYGWTEPSGKPKDRPRPGGAGNEFVGSLGQYLLWLFILTIVLVLGGAGL